MNAISTKSMTEAEWLEARHKGIGSSDAPTILGLNKYKSPYQLWLEKTGREQAEKVENDAVLMGHMLEDVVAQRYQHETGAKVIKDNKIRFREDKPFLMCNLDRIVQKSEQAPRGILECKTTTKYYLDSCDTPVPTYYYAQICHQLMVTGMPYGDLAVLVDGRGFEKFRVQSSIAQEFIDNLEHDLTRWWTDYIVADKEPPKIASDLLTVQQIHGSSINATEKIMSDLTRLQSVKAQLKELETEEKALKNSIIEFIQDNESIKNDEKVVATYKLQTKGKFNQKEFRETHPALYEKFLGESKFRVLRPKKL